MDDIIQQDIQNILHRVDASGFSGKTVLITGASGLIGSYFLSLLAEATTQGNRPSQIFAVSKTGNFPKGIEFKRAKFKILQGDLTNRSFCASLPTSDIVIHAAGYGQPDKFLVNPLNTIELNTTVTSSLVHKVNMHGKFLFFSSSEVYSGLETPPFSEHQVGTTNTNHPRSSYIEGKRCGEAIVNAARQSLNLDGNSIRLALAYGPGTKDYDSRALNSFIDQALTLGKIRLQDSGNAWRTYCYISDAIEMSIQVLFNGDMGVYNVGGESRTTILDLAKLIAQITKTKVVEPEAEGEPDYSAPSDVWMDIERIKSLSRKHNFISLKDGLERTIAWRQNFSQSNPNISKQSP